MSRAHQSKFLATKYWILNLLRNVKRLTWRQMTWPPNCRCINQNKTMKLNQFVKGSSLKIWKSQRASSEQTRLKRTLSAAPNPNPNKKLLNRLLIVRPTPAAMFTHSILATLLKPPLPDSRSYLSLSCVKLPLIQFSISQSDDNAGCPCRTQYPHVVWNNAVNLG